MSTDLDALNSYLFKNKGALDSEQNVHFVLGNEASDLDSMASSLLYGYFADQVLPRRDQSIYLPLINIPRADFKLRTEAVYLFAEAGVDLDNLVFADEIDLASLHESGRLHLTLIDHNKLAASQSAYHEVVRAIIDHHQDEGLYPNSEARIIEPVGSAATLVAEKIIAEKPDLIDLGTGTLLLGTILLDTVNLDPKAERVTPKDEEIAAYLLKKTARNQQELFDKLQFEKFNVASLATYDLLRKDYKEWQMGPVKCGIGSVLMPLKVWLDNDREIVAGFEKYSAERGLDLLLAMNAYTDPEFHRDLAVYSTDRELREKVVAHLKSEGIGLETIEPGDFKGKDRIALFVQKDLSKSRKKLQPILNAFFN
jgi:exopolyphosphatase